MLCPLDELTVGTFFFFSIQMLKYTVYLKHRDPKERMPEQARVTAA